MDTANLTELLGAGFEAASKGLGGKIVSDAYEKLKSLMKKPEDNAKTIAAADKLGQALKELGEHEKSPIIVRGIEAYQLIKVESIQSDGPILIDNIKSHKGSVVISDIGKE